MNTSSSSQFIYSDNERGIIMIGSTPQTSRSSRHGSTWSRSADLEVVDLTNDDFNVSAPTSVHVDEDASIRNLLESENHVIDSFLEKLDCPVCMESFLTILKNGNKLMSTICGHVFCHTCLFTAVKSSRKCPACRELLHLNSKSKQYMHRLYLPISLCKVSAG